MKAPLDWQRDMGWHDAATGRPLIEFGVCKPDYIEVVASPRGRELVVIDAKVCGRYCHSVCAPCAHRIPSSSVDVGWLAVEHGTGIQPREAATPSPGGAARMARAVACAC